jgi:hypothetical protein
MSRDILEELMEEEKKKDADKQKTKEKKKRHKLNHLATKEGVSLQEIEERLAQENEAKRVAEE